VDSFQGKTRRAFLSTPLKDTGLSDEKYIILASQSSARAAILREAGIAFTAVPANVEEDQVKEEGRNRGHTPSQITLNLARLKALTVSKQFPEDYILGADQILVCDEGILDKPEDMAAAREMLLKLCGHTHTLISAAVIYKGGEQVLEVVEEAHLTMRNFSDIYLDDYLRRAGEKILTSVGAYQLEAEGADLFENIEGDFYTILGLPLAPLKEFFRSKGLVGKAGQ